jgi:hypothetical protein
LEKVTKYCSTNSKVGGQVFLELAMAYEAVGRTQEAISVYTVLSTSRMENIKFNAKRLLYGIEAMQFMRDEAKSAEFSRKKVSQTFIDTTGLANIADNFDVRYNTAYVDLDKGGGFYRKLTENVVRSVREARQILLKATGSGEIDRIRIVQALRSMSRSFDEALKEEASKRELSMNEPIAIMNGIPIISTVTISENSASRVEDFFVPSAEQMIENLDGEWKLQLMADKKGDGVSFFNATLAWQMLDSSSQSYQSFGPIGFLTVSQKGSYDVDGELRFISRSKIQRAGPGAFLAGFLDETNLSGPAASTNLLQQIIAVDSELLITRIARPQNIDSNDNVKGYFSVWRRVQKGSFSQI